MQKQFNRTVHLAAAVLVGFGLLTGVARADTVKIYHDNSVGGNDLVNGFYNGSGHTSSQDTGAISAAGLAGVDLLIAWERSGAFSAGEIGAMAGFLAGGGRIAFFGENDIFDAINNNINAALTGLGSGIQIGTGSDVFFDVGLQLATGPQILGHALNAGVNAFQYGAPNDLNGVLGGSGLFLSQDLTVIFGAFDGTVGGDGVVVMTDSNVTDFINGTLDNDSWFLNLLNANVNGVPEPSSLILVGLGLVCLELIRRR